nr:hypothetical protein Iba_chr04aCG16970 [Ipomoea batatas]
MVGFAVLCLKGAPTMPDSFAVTIASYTFQDFWVPSSPLGMNSPQSFTTWPPVLAAWFFKHSRLKAIDLGIPSNFSLLLDSIDAKSGNPFALEFNLVSDEKDET